MKNTLLLLCTVACGGSTARPVQSAHTEGSAPWIAMYQRIADSACDCENAECQAAAVERADRLLSVHGDLESAPDTVQAAHEHIQHCMEQNSFDEIQDFHALAEQICACTNETCARAFAVRIETLRARYNFDALGEEAQADVLRSQDCMDRRSVPGAAYLPMVARAANAMCSCATAACADEVRGQFRADAEVAFPEGRYVNADDATHRELAQLGQRICGCSARVRIASTLAPLVPSGFTLDVTARCH